ncbi:MAG TPA: YndJ family transporter, partial [Saprospiraceae bacterium]|nr:YndJ family transporter [Saprospiraceae bacterium]
MNLRNSSLPGPGWLAWLLFLLVAGREFCHLHWEGALVLFAALLLVPMGLSLLGQRLPMGYWWAVAALASAYVLWPHPAAPLLALPYLLLAAVTAAQAAYGLWQMRDFALPALLRAAALGYWAVGAAWAVAFLAGYGPLGFSPDITALTAAHFHVAGHALTVATCCLLRATGRLADRLLGAGALLGMPAVA